MPEWTEEQKQVIASRGQDLLVSAAAGSGKTAVLVQRILEKILDPHSEIDIDRLLVVTFTNAAAASLREKIRLRLEEASAGEDPARAGKARRQLSMLAGDHIETIDRFCREIVLDHADALEIDPSFRIADEGERKLLQSEAVSQIMEESLSDPSEEWQRDYRDFARLYAPGKTDAKLEDLILRFYEFSMSHEFPRMWRHHCADLYRDETDSGQWVQDLTDSLNKKMGEIHESLLAGLAICRRVGGPYHYAQAMEAHAALTDRLCNCSSPAAYAALLESFPWPRPGRKKSGKDAPPVEEDLEKQVKKIRERAKKSLDDLAENLFYAPEDTIRKARLDTARYMDVLVRLTDLFEERFEKEKRARNIADFSDVAHWALQVLIRVGEDGLPVLDERGEYAYTPLAREYAEYFREIYIDEYQDSNRVQELLLQSIAKSGGRFMVGDMKQSIYRFRMADTGIFLEKASTYSKQENAAQRRIDLHCNFRSRKEVLEAVNLVFGQIMRQEIGGVEYSREEALRPGYQFPEYEPGDPGDGPDLLPELILAERGDVPDASSAAQAEAEVVAKRILAMVGRLPVYNKETGEYAPAAFGDITILLRTAAGWAQTFSRVLDANGIPNRPDASTGYFDSVEVRTILSYLSILDNPRQDIPLAACLRSVIGGLDDNALAVICAQTERGPLYQRILAYRESGRDPGIRKKLEEFLRTAKRLRSLVKDTPIHILLWRIFDETGFERKISLTPGGRQKKANLALLVDMAMTYEETSYRGLFHFIRYIEKLRKAQTDIGQASEHTGRENLVRIMTMHKSKGLEFPIVFVCGLNKKHNLQDARGTLVLHERLGAGLDYCDAAHRWKMTNRIRSVIAGRIRTDAIGEELRVLYVAMTRAEQKLILTGCVDSRKKAVERALDVRTQTQKQLSTAVVEGAGSMLDWILAALARHETERGFFDSGRWDGPEFCESDAAALPGQILIRTGQELMSSHERQSAEEENRLEELLAPDAEPVSDPALRNRLAFMLSRGYEWAEGREGMPGKLSVSALKEKAYREELLRILKEDGGMLLTEAGSLIPAPDPAADPEPEGMLPAPLAMSAPHEAVNIPVPEFMKETSAIRQRKGTEVGTAYHLVLASLDLTADRTKAQIAARLESMLKCDKIQKDEASGIDPEKIEVFVSSPLGRRMAHAAQEKKLWREQPFVIGKKASEIRADWSEDETILIQGIIDAFFLEEDQVVLVDYKSDRARNGEEESLVRRYREQFRIYADALEKLLMKKVKEAWLYSLSLGKAIPVSLSDEEQHNEVD